MCSMRILSVVPGRVLPVGSRRHLCIGDGEVEGEEEEEEDFVVVLGNERTADGISTMGRLRGMRWRRRDACSPLGIDMSLIESRVPQVMYCRQDLCGTDEVISACLHNDPGGRTT